MKTLLVTTFNMLHAINWPSEFTLEWAEKIIDCDCIEIVRPRGLPRKFVMLIDEEGKLKEHFINPICSKLYGYDEHGDYIAGDALIVKEAIINGEPDFTGLDDSDLAELRTTLMEVISK